MKSLEICYNSQLDSCLLLIKALLKMTPDASVAHW